MLTTRFIGDAGLRYGDDTIERPCWEVMNTRGEVIAQVFDTGGYDLFRFELWHEGVMWNGDSVEDAVRSFALANWIEAPDAIHRLALRGDGLEVTPVSHDPVSDSCEPCSPEDASMWSVYIHRDGQGVQCIADWQWSEQAYYHAAELLAAYPNLAQHGIVDGSL
jgi:hypothetical protein